MIVLDANILIRAVLGKRARYLIDTNSERVRMIAADTAVAEPPACSREQSSPTAGFQQALADSEITSVWKAA